MLNKNGWGLNEMLILSGILILFLFVAIYFIYTMYSDAAESFNDKYYQGLEEELEKNAKTYIDNYYDDVLNSDGIIISKEDLAKHNLDVALNDKMGRDCAGYVKASKTKGKTNIDAYISCIGYETKGYERER